MATGWRTVGGEVRATAEAFWLELGDLREMVRRADELELTDAADVCVGGVAKSTLLVDLATVKEIHVREVAYTKHEPSGEVNP
ncbi:hypothetical protein [Cellulosimicrobium funkei]|uniref:hypothetical protein n=1 Tax=Cellulosimicrobium funkei TaxID=264251 RepID=UPI0034271BA2